MSNDAELEAFLEKRNALFRNPNAIDAATWWDSITPDAPIDSTVPLASVHKARLQWLDATDDMIAQSIMWLEANNYTTECRGAPPLTPERRDADRVSLGKPPLNPESKK